VGETDNKYKPAGFLRSGYCEGGYFHPHLHCVVPGGGLSPDGKRWISCRPGFFLPVRVLSRLFRRLFLESLQKAFDSGKLRFSASLEVLRDRQAFVRLLSVTCSDITASRSPKSIMPTWRRTTCAQRSGNLKANWSKDLYPILYPMAQKSRIPTP